MCNWCALPAFASDRCAYSAQLTVTKCAPTHQISHPSSVKDLEDRPLSELGVQTNATQLRPQRIQIDLRLRQPIHFQIQFRQVIDYPLDLYYLMDLSNTMKDDKAKLAALGDTLAANMRRITRNFRLGFGSFVDKTTLPFIRTTEQQ